MTATEMELRVHRMRRKRATIRRLHGIPGHVEGAQVAAHLQALINSGWTRLQIAAASAVSDRAIRYILNGQREVQLANAQALFALQPRGEGRRSALGTARRVRALARAGYPIAWTAAEVGCSNAHVYAILNGTVTKISGELADRFADVYRRHEATAGPSAPARIAATAKDWTGPDGWDVDTIDDPDAQPDWTGHCGSDRGWWIHRIEGIRVCPACEVAHEEWKAERAHLDHKERWGELGRAKAAASNRGANLAADARELMRISGLDYEQTAARLGITRQHLQQELQRHPAPAEAAA